MFSLISLIFDARVAHPAGVHIRPHHHRHPALQLLPCKGTGACVCTIFSVAAYLSELLGGLLCQVSAVGVPGHHSHAGVTVSTLPSIPPPQPSTHNPLAPHHPLDPAPPLTHIHTIQPHPHYLNVSFCVQILDPYYNGRTCVQEMQHDGCSVIILLSHLGYTADIAAAQLIPGLHLVVGGHSHSYLVNGGAPIYEYKGEAQA